METIANYFGEWGRYLDFITLKKILTTLDLEYKTKKISPQKGDVFKVFDVCPYDKLKVVMLGQDPYPQHGIATGIMFGNNKTPISPSLEVIKNALINPEFPDYSNYKLDITLESWAKQGVLLLNSALTVEENRIGSHIMLWRPFISHLLEEISNYNPGLIFVLFGNTAKTFLPYINKNCPILTEQHPAWYARNNSKMSNHIFIEINKLLKDNNNLNINWYEVENE